MKRLLKIVLGVFVAVILIGILASIADPPATSDAGSTSGVTMANYLRIEEGMTLDDVRAILGAPGTEQSRSTLADITTVMYEWRGPGISGMNAMFQNGKLVTKAQFGLE